MHCVIILKITVPNMVTNLIQGGRALAVCRGVTSGGEGDRVHRAQRSAGPSIA